MKRIKEALWFVVPLVGLAGVSLLLWLLPTTDSTISLPQFAGKDYYLKLLLSDPIFLKGIFFTYLWSVLCGLAGIAVFTVIARLIRCRMKLSRPVYYAISGIVGCILAGIYLLCVVMAEARPTVAEVIGITSQTTSTLSVFSLYHGLIALQCGILAVFAVWVIEMVWRLIRRAKENA